MFSDEYLQELLKSTPVIALLIAALWAGHKGFWYWGPGVRSQFRILEQQRDDWRSIALALLREKGIDIYPVAAPPAHLVEQFQTRS